ncbi:MAG: hypothetical protein NTZ50_01965, partial [Chloroflexi bacterium]|nr:hypothetical protein [Chloroflexota bacterium]
IEATYLSTGLQAQPAAGQSYYVEIGYDENALGGVAESALRLYYWDGAKWVAEPTSQVDAAANRIMAWPAHFSSWAFGVLRSGSTPSPSPTPTPSPTPVTTVTPPFGSQRTYVPLVLRS